MVKVENLETRCIPQRSSPSFFNMLAACLHAILCWADSLGSSFSGTCGLREGSRLLMPQQNNRSFTRKALQQDSADILFQEAFTRMVQSLEQDLASNRRTHGHFIPQTAAEI